MSEHSDNQNKKRVLLVDDHPVLRKGLARLIDSKNGFVVCGEANSAMEAMELWHAENRLPEVSWAAVPAVFLHMGHPNGRFRAPKRCRLPHHR